MLRWQIREMKKTGHGGFFMHARGGLQTEYLSPEWMACVEACLDEAGKQGMDGWLYDENGWPSGFGGGLVSALGLKYQQKYLRMEQGTASELAKRERTIAFYAPDTAELLGVELPGGYTGDVLRLYYDVNPYYVDNMDAEVVAEFLRVTHQRYYETLPKELLAHLKGIFTDEPQLSRNGTPWSWVLEGAYRQEYGRELLPELPAMFLDSFRNAPAVRVRYRRLTAKLFRDHFMKQIRDWCDAHGWLLTGHHVLEETLLWQLDSNGAIMPQYQYYHIPGMDMLGRWHPSPVAMTQVTSVAAQMGQQQILTESFACCGWNINFTGMRTVYQPQLAHGINLLCQHLLGYTLRGQRKRDYPSSNSYHQPWWKDYRMVNDSFARIGMILGNGENRVHTLVLHPESSAWCIGAETQDKRKRTEYFTNSLRDLTVCLDARFVPHHYGDELMLSEIGFCGGGHVHVGRAVYDTIIIPPMLNISRKAYQMAKRLHEEGGRVYALRNPVDGGLRLVDGVEDSGLNAWLDTVQTFDTAEQLAAFLAKDDTLPKAECLCAPATQLLCARRRMKNKAERGWFYYFVSLDEEHPHLFRFRLPATGPQVLLLDAVSGELTKLTVDDTTCDRHWLAFDRFLGAGDSVCFYVPDQAMDDVSPAEDRTALFQELGHDSIPLSQWMKVEKTGENFLTLDRCRYRIDGGEWLEEDVISLQTIMLDRRKDADLEMEFDFDVAPGFVLETPLSLIVETPEKFRFALNGVPFQAKDGGYAFDTAFRRVALPPVQSGRNTISLAMRYTQPEVVYQNVEKATHHEAEYNKLWFVSEVENIYLAGDFSVNFSGAEEVLDHDAVRVPGGFRLGPSLVGKEADTADLIYQGLPFWAGTLKLSTEVELTQEQADALQAVHCPPFGANSCRVAVNGQDAGLCAWSPWAVPAAGLFHAGRNEITFELTMSLRNLLGPHHNAQGECLSIGTLSWNKNRNFANYPAPPFHPGYCFVRLGLKTAYLS